MIQPAIQEPESIRLEFECFLRIGQDRAMRDRLTRNLERLLLLGLPVTLFLPRIYFEVRQPDGEILEIWTLDMDESRARRLHGFLKRFNTEEVRLMDTMLRA